MISSYTFPDFRLILKDIKFKVALEIGSLHGLDAIEILNTYYPEKVLVVECNPECIALCQRHFLPYRNIELIQLAAWDKDEEISFFPVVKSVDANGANSHCNEMHSCNIGASSCFQTNGSWPYETYTQSKITVPARRLDGVLMERGETQVDLICMDVQGAELQALVGLGEYLKQVKAIVTELELSPMYHGQSLFSDVNSFLSQNGFRLQASNLWSPTAGDFLFLRYD